jgi:Holliday junction resolvase-like predicted endonuclease
MSALDLEVLHKGRREDEFEAEGEPGDAAWLQSQLRRWLAANKWARGRWGEFELVAREAGKSKVQAKVRA